jgi:regulator of replication initiation timing
MGNIDGLREQVEELKQRLNGPGTPSAGEPSELKARLASIKTSLESMQSEIARLTSEKAQLVAAREQLAADKRQLGEENEQLRKMLGDVLAAIDGQSADASANILQEFIAETDPLIKPAGASSQNVIAAGPPADHAAGPREQAAKVAAAVSEAPGSTEAQPQSGPHSGKPSDEAAEEEEESPALRRIMKRGRRAI